MAELTNPRWTPWTIDEAEFYELERPDDELRFLLRYAVLAPSGHNTQPWRFALVDDGVEFFADFTRRLPHVDPDARELFLSVGAAIANFRVAAAHFGFDTSVVRHDGCCETDAVATVTLRETCNPPAALRRLFPAITRRHTNRNRFSRRSVSPDALLAIADFAADHPRTVSFVREADHGRIASMVSEADRVQMQDRAIREEVADWIRPSITHSGDGICADGIGVPPFFSSAASGVIRRFDVGTLQARRDEELARCAPLLVALNSPDDRVSLVETGETLELLLLTITHAGLQYSFLNQPVQVPSLRRRVGALTGSQQPPQALIRIGRAHTVTDAMPRRPLDQVIDLREHPPRVHAH